MLILTRRIGESIIIGNNITLTVLGLKGNQARLGIDAPKDVPVNREEIHRKIKKKFSDNQTDKKENSSDTEGDIN